MRVGFEVSLVFGGVFFPNFPELLFLTISVHPVPTLSFLEKFWEIETWVIRPRVSLHSPSSEHASCCRDATESKFAFRRTLEVKLPKSNLACRGVRKFNPSNPAADVGNLQTKND
jgi:hypothetical protein